MVEIGHGVMMMLMIEVCRSHQRLFDYVAGSIYKNLTQHNNYCSQDLVQRRDMKKLLHLMNHLI